MLAADLSVWGAAKSHVLVHRFIKVAESYLAYCILLAKTT